jgi:hypothetical protein
MDVMPVGTVNVNVPGVVYERNDGVYADLPYKEFILQVVPLPPTPARVRTLLSFIDTVAVKDWPSSLFTL